MIRLYMDVHVRREVTVGLRIRGVDVLTAQEDGAARFADAELMPPDIANCIEFLPLR
jgi:hypothetical protein